MSFDDEAFGLRQSQLVMSLVKKNPFRFANIVRKTKTIDVGMHVWSYLSHKIILRIKTSDEKEKD